MRTKEGIEGELQVAINQSKRRILSAIERVIPKGSDEWRRIRAIVMTSLGERGLESYVHESLIEKVRGAYEQQ